MPLRLVLCSIAGALTLCAQPAAESGADISCIERLIVPNYPALAKQASLAADVTVSVVMGHDSATHRITTQVEETHGNIKQLFSERVEKAVRSSTFNYQCVGRTIELVFSFEPGLDMPVDGSKQTVSFSYPSRFTITGTATIMQP
jgi:hypothetical protein